MKYSLPVLLISSLILAGCTKTPVENQVNPSVDSVPTQTPALRSLKDLLGLGTAQKCTWKVTENGEDLTGTLWINGNKFKQVSTIPAPEGNIEVTAISDGQWMYTWNNQSQLQGVKMNLDALPTPGAGAEDQPQQVDLDKKLDYQCSPATLTDQDLTPPSNVRFMDMTEGIPQVKDMMKDFNPDQLKQFGQ